jgi:hypothetical protein
MTSGWFASAELRLFSTAVSACSKSGKRRTDLVLLRLLLELGFGGRHHVGGIAPIRMPTAFFSATLPGVTPL